MCTLQSYLICFYYQIRCGIWDGFVYVWYHRICRGVLWNRSQDLHAGLDRFLCESLTQFGEWLWRHVWVKYESGILRLILLLGTYLGDLVDTRWMDFGPETCAHISQGALIGCSQILNQVQCFALSLLVLDFSGLKLLEFVSLILLMIY